MIRLERKWEEFRTQLELGVVRPPSYGPISLNLEEHRLERIDAIKKTGRLTRQDCELYWLLIRAQGGVLSKEMITRWILLDGNLDLRVYKGLDEHMTNLRRKLDRLAGDKITIANRPQLGYHLHLLEAGKRV